MKNLNSRLPTLSSLFYSALIFTILLTLSSCFGSKPVSYFSNGNLDSLESAEIKIPDQIIQKGDLLSITVYSDNPEATAIFNQAGVAASASSSTTPTKSLGIQPAAGSTGGGYLVDNAGYIRMHSIGLIHTDGLTKDQLSDTITSKLMTLGVLTNPYCVIRYSNFKITVLGEVKSPGVFTVSGEKASILEAMGLAGDISDYGLKGRVLLIREVNGRRTYSRVDLLDPNIFTSPNFYLRQNDVLLVEADRRKPTALDQQTLSYITVAATVVSSIAILITLFQ
jgi:polysaccharide biosynthesis/export protein